jgi:putative selenate reductase FAD-binding subunit
MITEFVRPTSVDEAVSLGKQGYVYLAGGTQVNNAPFKKWGTPVERVASLDQLQLTGIHSESTTIVIGAMTTLQEIVDNPLPPEALRDAAKFIPTRSVRNVATIGGNIGANRPDSYVIPALIALGAEVVTPDGTRTVEEYVVEEMDDLILSIRIPPVVGVCRAVKESRSHLALPVVSAAVRIAVEDGTVAEAIVAAGCVGSHTRRLAATERAIEGTAVAEFDVPDRPKAEASIADRSGAASNPATPPLPTLEETISEEVTPAADILGSEAYKRYVNGVVIADLVRRCLQEVST